MKDAIRVHPNMSFRYYGYYLEGLQQAMNCRVVFTRSGLIDPGDPKDGLSVILPSGHHIFISANDWATIDERALRWSNALGKVNLAPGDQGRDPRILPIGPSFGISWRSTPGLFGMIVKSGLKGDPLKMPARLRDYLRFQRERSLMSAFRPGESDPDYLFYVATFWHRHREVNDYRALMFEGISAQAGLEFEGGFWSSSANYEEHERWAISQPTDHGGYVDGIRRSVVALNTPAVHDCLGWKLGEFLALGKAIVSTPLTRVMPGDFLAGEHYHLVDGSPESVAEAIALLRGDTQYRLRLERAAHQYWNEYLAPAAVAGRLIAHALDAPDRVRGAYGDARLSGDEIT